METIYYRLGARPLRGCAGEPRRCARGGDVSGFSFRHQKKVQPMGQVVDFTAYRQAMLEKHAPPPDIAPTRDRLCGIGLLLDLCATAAILVVAVVIVLHFLAL